MIRKLLSTLCLSALVLSLPAVAAADPAKDHPAAEGKGKDKGKFPMAGADFRKDVNGRIEKLKARVEKRISEKKVPEDRAKVLRDKLAKSIEKVNKVTDEVVEDGTVTKAEAKRVKDAFRSRGKGRHAKKEHKKSAG